MDLFCSNGIAIAGSEKQMSGLVIVFVLWYTFGAVVCSTGYLREDIAEINRWRKVHIDARVASKQKIINEDHLFFDEMIIHSILLITIGWPLILYLEWDEL